MTKAKDIIPRSKLTAHMPAGAATPRSGVYEQVGPRGGSTGVQLDTSRGKPLSTAGKAGQGWKLVTPARHKSGA